MSKIAWAALIILMGYYLTTLATAYHDAVWAWQDARNSKAYSILIETK